MNKRIWKALPVNSVVDGIRAAVMHARVMHNLSVEQVAERSAMSHHDLYKYMGNGRMPAMLIPAFEHASGCHLLTDHLSLQAGRIVIPIPAGRTASAQDVNKLQALLTEAVGQILAFSDGRTKADDALAAIHAGMAGLAWHRVNIAKHAQPELEFTE